jgi:ribosomal protein L27
VLALAGGVAQPAWGAAGSNILSAGQELHAGQDLISSGGQYTLVMQGDGNLVIRGNGCVVWASNTAGTGSSNYLIMQTDGNLVVRTSSGTAVWASNTAGTGSSNYLVMQTDGNLVVRTSSGTAVWASGRSNASHLCTSGTLNAGQFLYSGNEQYKLVMQTDGNLVVRTSSGTPVWASNTAGTGSSNYLVMQTDGNLVVRTNSGAAVWASNTAGTGSSNYLVMQTDGNLVVRTSSGTAVWASKSAGSGSGETSAEAAAVKWAESMVGSPSGQSGGEYWYGCLAFVINAHTLGADYPIRNDISVTIGSDTYPAQVWGHFLTGTTGSGNSPPAGALVFWDSTGGIADSHVAISVGNGNLVSTNVDQPSVPGYNGIHYETMTQFAANSWNIYKGWWLPDK